MTRLSPLIYVAIFFTICTIATGCYCYSFFKLKNKRLLISIIYIFFIFFTLDIMYNIYSYLYYEGIDLHMGHGALPIVITSIIWLAVSIITVALFSIVNFLKK